ncbi:MAG: ABC transporter permease [Saccharofermentans sp.]|nr:ABC transporter permease [Saccharofermentans sp.]
MKENRGRNIGYFAIKLVELVITLLLVSFMTFAAFSIIPGDAAAVILGPNATHAQVEALRESLGLNRPLHVQYFSWLAGAFTGDLGNSTSFNVSVSSLIAQRLPVTLGMSIIALIMVILVSYPLALVSSRRPGRIADNICSVLGHILFAIPPFVLSLVMILITSSLLGLVTVGNYVKPGDNFAGFIGCLLLPSFCIALPKIAMTFKFLRSSMIEQNASDHVRTARSHGLSDRVIEFKHILPNSNVSAITIISLVLSDILGGSLIVEQVFNLPGLGRLLLTGISRRDFPLLSGMILYLALMTVLLYFLADILTALSDPRIRFK